MRATTLLAAAAAATRGGRATGLCGVPASATSAASPVSSGDWTPLLRSSQHPIRPPRPWGCPAAASSHTTTTLQQHGQQQQHEQHGHQQQQQQVVPIVPGTYFRLAAGTAAVRVEHVAGWSDVATLRGRPAGRGSRWGAAPAGVESVAAAAAATAVGTAAAAAAGGGGAGISLGAGVRQVYDVRQEEVRQDADADSGAAGSGSGGDDHGGGGGLLVLAVPEKWISFDIRTLGAPVAVSKVTEANLRVATGGAAVTLGSVRALTVDIDTTTTTTTTEAAAVAVVTNGVNNSSDPADGAGSVTGGELSGTSISVSTAAVGLIRFRRLVGGSMRLVAAAAQQPPPPQQQQQGRSGSGGETSGGETSGSAAQRKADGTTTTRSVEQRHPAAAAPPAAPPAIELGAVYGGRLRIYTGGGAVRIGTLDCGGAAAVIAAGAGAAGGGNNGGGGTDGAAAGDLRGTCDSRAGGSGGDGGAGAGGAEILSYGGAVTLDGLEGDATVDSAGGAVKVLVQPGLRSALVASGGGNLEVALAPGTALQRLQVRRAAEVRVEPDLQRHLAVLPEEEDSAGGGADGSGSGGGSSSSHTASGVWAARVAAEVESGGGRGAGRGGGGGGGDGGEGQSSFPSAGVGGRLVIDAGGGGVVSIRRLGWMEALRARMEERGARQHQQ